jgi:hypothetical protein
MATIASSVKDVFLDRPRVLSERPLRVCSYEDRPEAMDGLILMGESLCSVDRDVSLHLTVPDAPPAVRTWAEGRPEVELSTDRPEGVTGWDVKPWLLLRELDAGWPESVWIDTDMIVTRPVSAVLGEFPRGALIATEEWDSPPVFPVCHAWNIPSRRPIRPINACFIRATQAHRTLVERYLRLVQDPRYREAQRIPFDRRPLPMLHDSWALTALLESEEFGDVPFDRLRLGRHIAQCAGSSGYRLGDRLRDLHRGLPPLIHCIGRKPWQPTHGGRRLGGFATYLATDLSPYVLAARPIARQLGLRAEWLEPRTTVGAILRGLTGCHPGMAGLPLAALHAVEQRVGRALGLVKVWTS